MMENGFSSPRNDAFPAGLRVLVVDDDPTWLKILEKMLKKCSYEVTTCGLARDALQLLRERKDGYDIVISDVNMPDMDGFKLLEHVGLEMDLPVIMMSVDGETSRVMKGVQHGACDYLLKPIRMKELRNIWQHVFRKKIHEVRDIEGFELTRNGSDQSDDGLDLISVKKRKDVESRNDDKDYGDSCSAKKARVVWSVDLHQKFVKAVHQIGFDKVGPKKILDLMNVPWLSRENVASHLQKYRLYLGRLQKENELKVSLGGIKLSDLPPKDSSGSCVLQNTNISHTDASSGSYGFSGSKARSQNVDAKSHDSDPKQNVSISQREPRKGLTTELHEVHKTRTPQVSFDHSYASLDSDTKYVAFDSAIPRQYTWNQVPEMQFKQESDPVRLEESFKTKLTQPGPQQTIQSDFLLPGHSVTEKGMGSLVDIKPLLDVYRSSHFNHFNLTGAGTDSFSLQSKDHVVTNESFGPSCGSSLNLKSQVVNFTDLEAAQKNHNLGFGTPVGYLDDGFQTVDFCQLTEFNDQLLFGEFPFHQFEYENLSDMTEYPVVDQALFIV